MRHIALFLIFASWATAETVDLPLYRTPPLYSTDRPAALEIPSVRLDIQPVDGKTVVKLEWLDRSRDAEAPAPDGFVDACAVMLPAGPVTGDVFPSLQMGDADHPVIIYYYDMKRGAAVMEASGRATTRRTGKTFTAQAAYAGQKWQVTLELPALPAGTPLSVAIWNGAQQDRDGRKYFSLWHRTR
ncbi:MAG: hypothetical protein HY238_05020 [Acidobacteria bacterium]|nr:hypothetical protein [Acidobacteriota bacterium]